MNSLMLPILDGRPDGQVVTYSVSYWRKQVHIPGLASPEKYFWDPGPSPPQSFTI